MIHFRLPAYPGLGVVNMSCVGLDSQYLSLDCLQTTKHGKATLSLAVFHRRCPQTLPSLAVFHSASRTSQAFKRLTPMAKIFAGPWLVCFKYDFQLSVMV